MKNLPKKVADQLQKNVSVEFHDKVVKFVRKDSFWNGVLVSVFVAVGFLVLYATGKYVYDWNQYFHREHERVVQLESKVKYLEVSADFRLDQCYRLQHQLESLQTQINNCAKLPAGCSK